MTRLIIEAIHRISSRPWVFVTGRLEGDALLVGDTLMVTRDGVSGAPAVVRSIELHGPPGKTTIAVDADLAETLQVGDALTRS